MNLLTNPNHLIADEEAVFSFKFVTDRDLPVGAEIYLPLYMKPFENFIQGMDETWTDNELVIVERSDNGAVTKENIITNKDFVIVSDYKIVILDTPLLAGERVNIQFGTQAEKLRLTRKQIDFRPECLYKKDQNSGFTEIEVEPVTVNAKEPVSVKLSLPSVVRPGVSFDLVVYFEDEFLNICDTLTGKVNIKYFVNDEPLSFNIDLKDISKDENLVRYEKQMVLEEEGVYWFEAKYNYFVNTGNPVVVDKYIDYVYWGDLHVHSQVSDGKGEIKDLIIDAYKRGWDFIAVADHSFGREQRGDRLLRLERQSKIIERYTVPGKFYPLFAGETHYLWYTHLNMYFRHNDPVRVEKLLLELEKSLGAGTLEWDKLSQSEVKTKVTNYWKAFNESEFGEKETLSLFHHTMWLGNLGYMDEKMRLIEMSSIFGSSETREQVEETDRLKIQTDRIAGDQGKKMSVREALDSGFKLGFVGGSDNHEGQAGSHSITAVRAKSLTMENIWDAMYNRECYSTTAHKTLLYLKAFANSIKGQIISDREILYINFVADGEVVYTINGKNSKIFTINYSDVTPYHQYIYMRVIFRDESMAWSSPIWKE